MNDGLNIEKNIIKSYDNKKFSELNEFQRTIIVQMFGEIEENWIIKCKKYYNSISKVDLIFSINNTFKYVICWSIWFNVTKTKKRSL